jgi:hypothetical protein
MQMVKKIKSTNKLEYQNASTKILTTIQMDVDLPTSSHQAQNSENLFRMK